MGFGIRQTWLHNSCMLLAGRLHKRTFTSASSSERTLLGNEKKDIKKEWRQNGERVRGTGKVSVQNVKFGVRL